MVSADWAWMAVVAREELAKLEAAYPTGLGPLKAELKHLIAEPSWDGAGAFPLVSPYTSSSSPSASSSQPAAPADVMFTQESTNRRRRCSGEEGKRRRRRTRAAPRGKDSADMAIERAKKCLKRIRAVKQSLLCSASRIETIE